jgi:hypothetical protein
MNYKDLEEVKDFIQGMTYSIKETTQEQIDKGDDVPDVQMFLLKRTNEEGETQYGMGGGQVPSDELGKILHSKIVPEIIKHQGHEILGSCSTNFSNGVMKIDFVNYVTNENHQEVMNFNTPFQVTDKSFMSVGEMKFSLN